MHIKKRASLTALVGVLALAGAACGSDSDDSASTSGSGSSQEQTQAADKVTAIPSLTGVGTSVILDAGTAGALKGLGVAIAPSGSATFEASTSTITFPITGGYAEIHSNPAVKPGYIMGSVNHEGSGFTLTAGATKVTLDDFVVDPGNSILYGSVNGTPGAPLLSLDGSNVKVSMESGNVVLFGTVAKLTDAAASALNGAFKTQAIKAGTPLGVVRLVAKGTATTYEPATDKTAQVTRLGGKQTAVKLDAGTADALKSLNVTVAPTGTAKFDAGTGTVSFPITGGFAAIHSDKNYKPGYIAGNVIHQGSGLKFSSGSKSIEVTDFVVDPGSSILTATAGGKAGIPLLSLDGTNVAVSMSGSDVVLQGTVAKLTATGASALNSTFGVSAFKEGIPLGVVTLTAAQADAPKA
ncbi:MAG: hypothetical protein ACR2KK_09150 [Acidimicrobiales bacterium]